MKVTRDIPDETFASLRRSPAMPLTRKGSEYTFQP